MRTEAPEQPTKTAGSGKDGGGRRRKRAGQADGAGLRQRLLPKTVLGMVSLLLAASIGFAFGGTVLYAYYQYKLDNVEKRVNDFIEGFEGRRDAARKEIAGDLAAAKEDIRKELEPIEQLRASGETLQDLIDQVKDSTYLIETQDEFGQAKVGSAFVVTSDAERSYLLTSLSVVRSSTKRPGPAITLRRGDERFEATLHTWQEERDLALLVVDKGSLPRIKWAPADDKLEFGQRVFVVAGVGGAGGSITQGSVADVSAAGIQHDAAATGAFSGGPLLNSKGEAVGVATPAYAPLGFTSDRITFASPIRAACEKVLKCPEGAASPGGAGERR
ncbi:MAG: trypsin-like peptidase domain-containing protein [Acidimicrobiia bacterium]